MAKELSAADVAAFFASKGIELPAELATITTNEVADKANEVISAALVPFDESDAKARKAHNDLATKYQTDLFDLAHRFSSDFRSETNNVGRGSARQNKVTIETPDGTLFVRLSKTIAKK